MRPVLIFAWLVLLGGCVETRFESPPAEALKTCDARLKGLWTGSAPGDRDAALYVDAACTMQLIDKPARAAPRRIPLPARFAHLPGADYIVIDAAALKPLADLPPPHGIDPPPAQAWFLTRYAVDARQLSLTPVDTPRVARHVLDGTLDGSIDKSHGELHVFVRGDAARISRMLRDVPIFDPGNSLVLTRSTLDAQQFERELARGAVAPP